MILKEARKVTASASSLWVWWLNRPPAVTTATFLVLLNRKRKKKKKKQSNNKCFNTISSYLWCHKSELIEYDNLYESNWKHDIFIPTPRVCSLFNSKISYRHKILVRRRTSPSDFEWFALLVFSFHSKSVADNKANQVRTDLASNINEFITCEMQSDCIWSPFEDA